MPSLVPRFDRYTIGLLAVNVLSVTYLTLAPALVGAFIDRLHLRPDQAGLITSAQLAGSAVGVGLVLFGLCRGSEATLLRSSTILMAACDLYCSLLSQSWSIAVCRAIAGTAAGVAFAVVNAAAGRFPKPARMFASLLTAQMAFGIAGYLGLPPLLEAAGLRGVFIALGALALLSLPFIARAPYQDRQAIPEATPLRVESQSMTLLCLASLAIMYVSNSAVWTYLDRIGVTAGLTDARVDVALAWSMGAGFAGAVLASMCATRIRPETAALAGVLVMATCTTALFLSHIALLYTVAVAGFNGTLMYVVPFYFAQMAAGSHAHRNVSAASMVIFVGLAAGPFFASYIVVNNHYDRLVAMATIGFVTAAALVKAASSVRRAEPREVRAADT
jgi:predicted MFS family arabinose efflux permease